MGYFYWLHVKSLNYFHTELNLGYLKGTKFCLDSKASFVDIRSIASFKPFLIALLRHYFSFSNSSVVLALAKIHPVGNYFPKKNHVLLSNFFPLQICSSLGYSEQIPEKKNRVSPCSFKRKGEFSPLSSLD